MTLLVEPEGRTPFQAMELDDLVDRVPEGLDGPNVPIIVGADGDLDVIVLEGPSENVSVLLRLCGLVEVHIHDRDVHEWYNGH